MKRFTSFLFALLAVVCSFSAAADNVTFQIQVDRPTAVICTVNGTEQTLTEGLNDISVPMGNSVVLESVAPYMISSVVNKAGTPENVNDGAWSKWCYSDVQDQIFTVTTINLDDARTASCTIKVDDPSRVEARLQGYSYYGFQVELTQGDNTLKFDPAKESLSISSADYSKPLYEVKLGEEVLTPNYGSYSVNLTDGCVVTVTALVPDKDVFITFEYGEGAEGAIKTAKVEGEELTDFDGKKITMKAGQSLDLASDPAFCIDEVTANGEKVYWYSSYNESAVMNDIHFVIKAHRYAMINYTVTVDNPENIIFYNGYGADTKVDLVEGENKLAISEANTYVKWEHAKGALILTSTCNGEPLQWASTQIKEGDKLVFTTEKINYDKTAVVWVDNRNYNGSFFVRCGDTDEEPEIATGYNTIPFYDKMLPFGVSYSVYADATLVDKVYLDGVLLQSKSDYGCWYEDIDVKDKSVIKVFIFEEPVNCNVTFNAPEGLEATVTYDRVKTLDKLADGLACFKGTEVAIEGADDLTVKVGETELEKNNDGKFVFTVADPATTVTLADKSSGVENVVIATEADASAAVYTLMGVRVGTRADLNTLPAGIYVLNGQKVIVK